VEGIVATEHDSATCTNPVASYYLACGVCIDYKTPTGAANSVIYDCSAAGSTANVAGSNYNQASCAGSGTCFYLNPTNCNKNSYTAQGGSQVVPGTDAPYEALSCTSGNPKGPTPCPTNRPTAAQPLSLGASIAIIVVIVCCCAAGIGGGCYICRRNRNMQQSGQMPVAYGGGPSAVAYGPNGMPAPYGQPYGGPPRMMMQQGHTVMGDDGQPYYNSACFVYMSSLRCPLLVVVLTLWSLPPAPLLSPWHLAWQTARGSTGAQTAGAT
jgi:hypothetical protein